MVPYFLVIVLAAAWKQNEHIPRPQITSRWADYAVSQILPVVIPLSVIFMNRVRAAGLASGVHTRRRIIIRSQGVQPAQGASGKWGRQLLIH
jgi:hypothetical protein